MRTSSKLFALALAAAWPQFASAQEAQGTANIPQQRLGPWEMLPIIDPAQVVKNEIAAWLINQKTGAVYVCSAPAHQATVGNLKCIKANFDSPPAP